MRLVRAHVRAARGALATVAAIVVALTLASVAAPLAVTAILDASVRHEVDALSPTVRDLSASRTIAIAAPFWQTTAEEARTWSAFDASIDGILAEAPAPVRESFDRAEYTARLGEPAQNAGTTYAVLDPRYAERIRVVEGRLPAHTSRPEQWLAALGDGTDSADAALPALPALPATEIVLSAAAAEAVQWDLGETRTVGPEAQWAGLVPLTLVGTFEAVDPDDPYWLRATGMLGADEGSDSDGNPFVRTAGFANPEAVSTLSLVALQGAAFDVWWQGPADVTAADASALLEALRATTSRQYPLTAPAVPSGYGVLILDTGTIGALEAAIAQNASLVAVIAMLLAGPVGVALAVLVLGCRLVAEARRPALALLAARGASPGQRRALLAADGLLAGVVPAAVAALVAVGIARVVRPDAVIEPALLVLPAVVALLPAAIGAVTATRLRPPGRADGARPSILRVSIEIGVLLLAGIATALLVARGTEATDAGLDPLAVAAPLLLSLAACVLALRVYPLALDLVLRRERRRAGFVGLVGAARARRDPTAGVAPILSLIVGVSFAVTGGILLSIVQQGAIETARTEVGTDLRMQAPRLPDDIAPQIQALPGVDLAVGVRTAPAVSAQFGTERARVTIYAADPAALADVQRGFPAVVPEGTALSVGGAERPLLVASESLAARGAAEATEVGIGDTPVAVAATAPDAAPFATGLLWALVADDALPQITDGAAPVGTVLVRLAPDADGGAVADDIRALVAGLPGPERATDVLTVDDALAAAREEPAVTGLRTVLVAGIVASAALSAVAVVATLVLGAPARRRILALVHTLGAAPRSAGRLVAWELAPVALAALVVGSAFGAALPVLLMRVIDLRTFTGGAAPPAYAADPLILALSVGGFVVLAAVLAGIAIALTRRIRAASVLRTVEDT